MILQFKYFILKFKKLLLKFHNIFNTKFKNIYKIIKDKTLIVNKKSYAHFLINSFIVKRKK